MSAIAHSQTADIPSDMTSTTFDPPGCRIVASLGVVRGGVVRARSVSGTMPVQAETAGADAVIGIRHDATEVMQGVTEVICHGKAMRVEELPR